MIRWRHQGDDRGIVELVRSQLVPISPWYHPKDGRLHSIIQRRLRKGATLVAAESRRSAPFAFLHMEFRERSLYIDLLAVHGRHQNRHWGTALMGRAEAYGRRKGCVEARVFVDEANSRGIRFYGRLGYQMLRHVKALKVFEMGKPL